MGDAILIALGAFASVFSGPIGLSIRSWIFRRRGTGRVLVESATGTTETTFGQAESAPAVAARIEELIEAADAAAVSQPKPHDHRRRRLQIDITPMDLIYGAAMIAGIVAKAIWDYEQQHDGRFGIVWGKISAALLVAPIVYVGVSAALEPLKKSLTLVGLGLAFQNGFFWQSVFATSQSGGADHP